MRIKILRNTVCGDEDVFVDNVINADNTEAKYLIRTKKAEETSEKLTGAVRPAAPVKAAAEAKQAAK